MVTVRNIAKEKLDAGELTLGVGLRNARTVDIAKAMKTAGYDWLFIDMEHNTMSLDVATQISVAAQDAGITPLVRVPGFAHHHASRALDGGAQGIVVPHVDDAETAARMVANVRYPPEGRRSMMGAIPQVDFETHPTGAVARAVNEATLLVLMLESPASIDRVDEIAAVPGYDALLVGTNDLCMEMGIPGQVDHPDVVDAFARVIAACRRHGKHPGMGGVYTPPLMHRYFEMGMRLILAGSDHAFLMAGARAHAQALREKP
ncbi:MAG: HpcH/HpaI aldolase family protein [Pseudomonadota bacterium]